MTFTYTSPSLCLLLIILAANTELGGTVRPRGVPPFDPSSYTDPKHHVHAKWWEEIALPSWPGITELMEFAWLRQVGLGPISEPTAWTKGPLARPGNLVPQFIEADPTALPTALPPIAAAVPFFDPELVRGIMLAFYLALFLFFGGPIIAVILTYTLPPLTSKSTSVIRRGYGYIFCAHRNPVFGANFEISVRATVGIVLLSLPFLLPSLRLVVEKKYYSILSIIIYFLTMGKTVGGTMQTNVGVCFGVFLAVLNVWVMNGINPNGYHKDSGDEVFWVGVADYLLFTMFILATEFGLQVKVPCMIFHGVFMMDFINPSTSAQYSEAWRFNIRGVAVSGLVQAMLGAGLGTFACLLPYPLFALDKARDISLNMVEELGEAWHAGLKCFASATHDARAEAILRHHMDGLSAGVNELGGLDDASWWESMGLSGKPRQVRTMLFTLTDTIQESYARLLNVQNLCQVAEKTPEHVEMMEHMKPHLESLTKQASDLLGAFVEAAIDGGFDDDEEANLNDMYTKVKQALETVANEFHKKQGKMKSDLFDAASFCLSYSAGAQNVLDLKEQGEESMKSVSLLRNLKAYAGNAKISIFHDPTAFNVWLRNFMSILLCFVVGLNGYSTILPKFSVVGLETACLLLSSGLTMQAKDNLDRFLSVVVGTIFGQLAYSLFGWCGVGAKAAIMLSIVVWSFMMLFMVHHYGQGLLCGFMLVYFLIGVLNPCSDTLFEAGGSYVTIIATTVAITIKVAVDILLARARASDEALKTMVSAWDQLDKALINFFDPAVETITFSSSPIADAFTTAKNLSEDASKEPRYYWCDWKHNIFVQTCDAGVKISQMLSSLENTFCETGQDGDAKANALTVFQKLDSSVKVKEDLILRIESSRNLCSQAFGYKKTDLFATHYEKPKNLDDYSTLVNRVYEAASRAAKESDEMGKTKSKNNLEHDLVCKMGNFITNVRGMHDLMEKIETDVLSG